MPFPHPTGGLPELELVLAAVELAAEPPVLVVLPPVAAELPPVLLAEPPVLVVEPPVPEVEAVVLEVAEVLEVEAFPLLDVLDILVPVLVAEPPPPPAPAAWVVLPPPPQPTACPSVKAPMPATQRKEILGKFNRKRMATSEGDEAFRIPTMRCRTCKIRCGAARAHLPRRGRAGDRYRGGIRYGCVSGVRRTTATTTFLRPW